MNKKGFTLMELLLVVAVLAIVAAAAAPTFFGGAQEAMQEAKKSSFMSAYQNTLSGANLMVSIAASQGNLPDGTADVDLSVEGALISGKKLDDFAPAASRNFALNDTASGTLSASWLMADKTVHVMFGIKKVDLPLNSNLSYDELNTLITSGSGN